MRDNEKSEKKSLGISLGEPQITWGNQKIRLTPYEKNSRQKENPRA